MKLKHGTYTLEKDKLIFEGQRTILASINGQVVKIRPENPMYWTVRHYGKYKRFESDASK